MIVESHPQPRHRRFYSEVLSQLATLAGGSSEEILLQALRKQEPVETAVLTLPILDIIKQEHEATR